MVSGNMGPGDFADPGSDDDNQMVSGQAPGASDVPAQGDDEADFESERSSEIDDITASMSRPSGAEAAAGDAPDGDGGEAEIDPELLADVDVLALLGERDEYKALAQRVQADFDNFRRRSGTQAQADVDRATGKLAEALLPVLDAAEAAYLRHPEEVGPLLNQMLVELRKQGLEALDLDGQPFDPEVAEAVSHEAGGGGEPVVAEVLRSGYTWKGRTLRPAMVRTRD